MLIQINPDFDIALVGSLRQELETKWLAFKERASFAATMALCFAMNVEEELRHEMDCRLRWGILILDAMLGQAYVTKLLAEHNTTFGSTAVQVTYLMGDWLEERSYPWGVISQYVMMESLHRHIRLVNDLPSRPDDREVRLYFLAQTQEVTREMRVQPAEEKLVSKHVSLEVTMALGPQIVE